MGGTDLGNASCAHGHDGPLCGHCAVGFYRNRRACVPCGDTTASRASVNVIYSLTGTLFLVLFLACAAYIYRGARPARGVKGKRAADGASEHAQRGRHARRAEAIRRALSMLPRRLVAASTMFRILLAYCQCMAVVLTFDNVAWPPLFATFVEVLEVATIEIFALVPVECALSTRFGYGTELAITLSLPLVSAALLLSVTSVLMLCAGRYDPFAGWRAFRRSVFECAEMWDVLIFLFLFEYPVIARKSLAVFDCVPHDGETLLADDTSIGCYNQRWSLWALFAISGVVLFGLGLPLVLWLIVRSAHAASQPARRRMVQVLTWVYEDSCWYLESVDLLRKFMLRA